MENTTNFNKKLQTKFGFPVAIFNYVYQHYDVKLIVHCLACGSAQLYNLKKQITEAKKKYSMRQLASFVLEFNAAHGLVDFNDPALNMPIPFIDEAGRIHLAQSKLKEMEKVARNEARKLTDEAYKELKELTDSYKKVQANHTKNWLALKKKIESYVEVIKMKNSNLNEVGDIKGLPEVPKAPTAQFTKPSPEACEAINEHLKKEAPKPETPTPAPTPEPAPLTPKKEGKLIKYKLNRNDAARIVKKLAEGIKDDPYKNEFFLTFVQEAN